MCNPVLKQKDPANPVFQVTCEDNLHPAGKICLQQLESLDYGEKSVVDLVSLGGKIIFSTKVDQAIQTGLRAV